MTTIDTSVSVAILLIAIPVFAQNTAEKLPAPGDKAQGEATKLIKEVYGDEWAAAKSSTEKQALAKKLLGKADETTDDPVGRFVLLRLARDIATQAVDGRTAFQAIDAMAESFQVDALEMKTVVLTKGASAATMSAQHKAIAEEALKLVDQAVSQNTFTIADRLGALALAEARTTLDKDLLTEAQRRIREVADLAKAYEDVKAARLTVEKTPDDPEANLAVGKYLCFVKGDWDRGLAMLALGKDEALKALAKQEIDGAASSTEQARLGDGWWSMAEDKEKTLKKQMQARAGYWYRKALPGLTGLMKAKVEKRLAVVDSMTQVPQSNPFPRLQWVDLLKEVDPARDQVAGKWTRSGNTISVDPGQTTARLVLPAIVEGSYDLMVQFTRRAGDNDVNVVMPVGSHSCVLMLSGFHGWISGIRYIDGKDVENNPTARRPGNLVNNRRYDMLIGVRVAGKDVSIQVRLNGKPYIGWTGEQAVLSVMREWVVPCPQRLGLGACSNVDFHVVRFRSVAGSESSSLKER